jgi:hypothetical protein
LDKVKFFISDFERGDRVSVDEVSSEIYNLLDLG